MRLQLADIKRVAVGAVLVEECSDGFHFFSMTNAQLAAFLKLSEGLYQNAAATTGVRLDFTTNSSYVKFMTLTDGKYEIQIDGMLTEPFVTMKGTEVLLSLPSDGRTHRVTLNLPAHGRPGGFAFVELSDGATLARHVFDRKFLFLGDSITQGYNAEFDTLSYAQRVSDHFNAESIIQGTGGAYYDVSTLQKLDFQPDTVFVAYGTNDAGKFQTLAEIRTRCHTYLSALIPMYEGAKIYVITPPWRMNGDIKKACGYVSEVNDAIAEVAAALGLTVVDGGSMIPHDARFMADNLHPNALGFSLYAHNLIKVLTT